MNFYKNEMSEFEMIYLDNSATTKPCPQAVEGFMECAGKFGNPSSLHGLGLQAEQLMENARENIAESLGCRSEEIYFTSCATESSNTAIFGTAEKLGRRKKRFVTTTIEHPATARAMDLLEEKGFEVVRIAPNEKGEISYSDILNAVDDNTAMVSMMLVNNETGYILPVQKTFEKIKKRFPDVLTHCDAVQGYMKMPVNVNRMQCDFLSLSGHKIHAFKGIGVLYIKKGIRIPPMIVGGGQENAQRSGTQSVPLIYSMGLAVNALNNSINQRFEYISKLKADLVKKLSELDFVHINSGSAEDFLPYVVSFAVEKIKSEVLLHYLESKEIYVSSGSACSRGKKSGVLSEFKISDKLADSTIRVSFCADNTPEDIDTLVKEIINANDTLAKLK